MIERALIDTGVLVSILDPRQRRHQDCVQAFKTVAKPLITCEPAITEAAYLLAKLAGQNIRPITRLIAEQAIDVQPLPADAYGWIAAFQEKYADQRVDFTDAALCYQAETLGIHRVLSLDSDFHIYRLLGGKAFEVLPG